ncbi:hypothetical protein [Aequorivita echinoideorum]|uniref:DUF4112 domain-containing protein n=1 Tax=Aequorivita echinoideorum TaxID=1549647 RepID=A0ABS5S6U3_9FLAO|nr:hypothetical protein [Aequorivita echinoideorum]MBT0608936.1 hypothetical protein [Aequorivita echinoideorum]
MKDYKYKLLTRGIIYDAIGMVTMVIPFIGPFLDIIWAPIAAKEMSKMYDGYKGKIASVLVFLEEILPFTDVIPTFTLMWLYTYVWRKQPEPKAIKIKVNE